MFPLASGYEISLPSGYMPYLIYVYGLFHSGRVDWHNPFRMRALLNTTG